MWGIFGVVVMYYAPLYMSGVGLSSAQIGLLGSFTLACSFAFQLLAASITNRLGRRRTTLIWDLISWTLPMFIWATAHSLAAFLVAAFLSASGRIVAVSWSLLLIEDVEQPQQARVFGIINLINAFCGLLTPLVGLVIARAGVVPTLRTFYLLGGVGMTVMFLWRNALTQETRNGEAAMREHRDLKPWQSLARNLHQLQDLRNRPGLPGVVAFYVLTVFTEQMNLFQILFFSQTLRFGASAVSLVPVASAAVTILMYSQVLRRLAGVPAERTLVYTRVLGLLGAALVLFIPAGHLPSLLLVVSLLAGATFLTQTYRDAALFSHLPQRGAADLYSGVQTLTMLCSVPAAGLAGALFSAQPRLLFVVITLLSALLLVLALQLSRSQRRRAQAGAHL
ncbi:MFS transporter [Deinococcus irradiatisoli]|uniref:MFS transporter n=1 Tax=Deinococcus irradiatisoli TaxID=2202254 RepID=A0A2Z3JNT3_9DEIO|nr:MFS transporter [Deinococcus irradiatisoli]